ncbi:MAG: hypothetical protein AB1333_03025 [Patescibacteria group bacterium]
MEVPNNIRHIFEKIEKSEDEWKALYMAVWYYSYYIKDEYIDSGKNDPAEKLSRLINGSGTASTIKVFDFKTGTGTASSAVIVFPDESPGEEIINLELPASKKGHSYKWKPKELYSILTSRDGQFTLGHLQTLFSLFEELLCETSKTLFDLEINTGKWKGIETFFSQNSFKDILLPEELGELKLAKETRNCFIHNNSKIDDKWLSAYQGVRETKTLLPDLIGADLDSGLQNTFHEIENWHDLIVDISKRIVEKISRMN